jgi:putative transposase
MESFFGLIKKEELSHKNYLNLEEVRWDCFKYLDGFYNTTRIHSYLDYMSPVEFEKEFVA